MADDAGTPPDPLTDARLGEVPHTSADFFQALRRLECAYGDRPRLGEALHALEEPVRLGQEPTLAFEGSSLVSVKAGEGGAPTRVTVGFFGAFGPNGPLPLHLTEYAQQRARNAHDPTFSRFVNVFHHRLLLLFYRAWANAQPVVSRDRPHDDHFAGYVGALSGRGIEPTKSGLDEFARFMAGFFATQSRHAEGLARLLTTYFRVPAHIEEFVGEWLEIPDAYTWRLGRATPIDGAGRLGLGSRLGRRSFERQGKFRVVLGPLSSADYQRFLPRGEFLNDLKELVDRYAGPELSWDVRLVLELPARAPTRLNGTARLGRTSHLVRQASSAARPFQDFVFTPLDDLLARPAARFDPAVTRGDHG